MARRTIRITVETIRIAVNQPGVTPVPPEAELAASPESEPEEKNEENNPK
jgi:hypothetical protein